MVSEIPLRRRFDVERMLREMDLLWNAFFLKRPVRKVQRERARSLSIDVSETKEIVLKIETPGGG